jgi:predicted phage terminase large subunit-like protein
MKRGPSNPEGINPENVLALAAQDLACYTQLLQPQLQLAPHTVALIDRFEMVERRVAALPALAARVGQATGIRQLRPSREIWQLPPQYGKTTMAQLAVSWFLGRHPDLSVIWASYGATLAEDTGKRIRAFLSDPLHRACFPGCEIAADSAAQDRIGLTGGGGAFFVGREGAITGRSATGLLLLDDMLKGREEADSATIRDNLKKWFQQVAFTRLAPNAACVLIGTPWHQDDLLGWLPREFPEQGWRVLRLPALAEEDDVLGRPPGTPLWPQKHDAAQLESIRAQMGSQAFVSLMQLRPSAASGTIFKREWFRLLSPPWPSFQRIIQSWDTAFGKSAKRGDYSACCTVGINNNGAHILHVWKGRPDFPALKAKVQELAREWKVSEILVEDTGAGTSLAQELAQDWSGFDVPRIIPRDARGAKRLRMELVSPMVEAGKVFFADGPWLPEFLDELAGVPDNVVHDDCADAFCQALSFLREGYSIEPPPFQIVERPGPLAWLRAALAERPPLPRTQNQFWEPHPVLPQPAYQLTGEAAEASRRIAEGNSRPDDIDKVMGF